MCQKIQYTTQKEAKEAAVGLSRRSKFNYDAYKCKDCGCYHITTTNKHTLAKEIKGRPPKESFHKKVVETLHLKVKVRSKMTRERPIITTGKLLTQEQANFLKQKIRNAG